MLLACVLVHELLLPPYSQCTGFRKSTVDIRMPFGDMFATAVGSKLDMTLVQEAEEDVGVFYAVSNSDTWVPGSVYDCPSGYHWASTEEGQAYFRGQREGTGAYRPYPPDGEAQPCTLVDGAPSLDLARTPSPPLPSSTSTK